jgi:hypothetical protein
MKLPPDPSLGVPERQLEAGRRNERMHAMHRLNAIATVAIVWGASALIAAGPAQPDGIETATYRHIVTVGCAPPNGKTIAYVWHWQALPEPAGSRVFKALAEPDVEECLSEIVMTKRGLYERLVNLGRDSGQDAAQAVMKDAVDAWTEFGVYEAVQEVASTGARGPRVDVLLRTCEGLERKRQSQ